MGLNNRNSRFNEKRKPVKRGPHRSSERMPRTLKREDPPTYVVKVDNRIDFSVYREKAPRMYGVIFYDSFPLAKADGANIVKLAEGVDQLNVVIAAEGNMDDAELLGLSPKVKVFAGAAWHTIHQRRFAEGWYQEEH